MSQSGFISIIYAKEGVPNTFIISTNWSMLLSERKIGYKEIISAKIHPADHISI